MSKKQQQEIIKWRFNCCGGPDINGTRSYDVIDEDGNVVNRIRECYFEKDEEGNPEIVSCPQGTMTEKGNDDGTKSLVPQMVEKLVCSTRCKV